MWPYVPLGTKRISEEVYTITKMIGTVYSRVIWLVVYTIRLMLYTVPQ